MNPHTCGHPVFEIEARNYNRKKESIFNKWCWSIWTSACRKMPVDPYLSPCAKHKTRCIKYLNLKPDILVAGWGMPLVSALGEAAAGCSGPAWSTKWVPVQSELPYLLVLSSETIVTCTFCIHKLNFTLENLNLYYQSRELCIKFFFIDTVLHIENVLHKDICDGFLHFTNCCALWESI